MFHKPNRPNNSSVKIPPPKVHLTAYASAGLRQLYNNIKIKYGNLQHGLYLPTGKEEYGSYTDRHGRFAPKQGMPLLAKRYQFVKMLGKGQSSVCIIAKDTFCQDKEVSIKMLHTNYHTLGPQESFCILQLNGKDPHHATPTLRLLNLFSYETHYCLVFELLQPTPLNHYFRQIPCVQKIPLIKKVAAKLLKAIGFMQQENVIHADLKPENILLAKAQSFSTLKVVDFGNAIHCTHDEMSLYYETFELQTLLYRAPEVLFGMFFGLEIDMWSLGCVLAELYLGKPLFQGADKLAIMKRMVDLLGPFPPELFRGGKFAKELSYFLSDRKPADGYPLFNLFDHHMDFADFVYKLLHYDQRQRMTVQQAACHPFLQSELGCNYLLNKAYPKVYPGYREQPEGPNTLNHFTYMPTSVMLKYAATDKNHNYTPLHPQPHSSSLVAHVAVNATTAAPQQYQQQCRSATVQQNVDTYPNGSSVNVYQTVPNMPNNEAPQQFMLVGAYDTPQVNSRGHTTALLQQAQVVHRRYTPSPQENKVYHMLTPAEPSPASPLPEQHFISGNGYAITGSVSVPMKPMIIIPTTHDPSSYVDNQSLCMNDSTAVQPSVAVADDSNTIVIQDDTVYRTEQQHGTNASPRHTATYHKANNRSSSDNNKLLLPYKKNSSKRQHLRTNSRGNVVANSSNNNNHSYTRSNCQELQSQNQSMQCSAALSLDDSIIELSAKDGNNILYDRPKKMKKEPATSLQALSKCQGAGSRVNHLNGECIDLSNNNISICNDRVATSRRSSRSMSNVSMSNSTSSLHQHHHSRRMSRDFSRDRHKYNCIATGSNQTNLNSTFLVSDAVMEDSVENNTHFAQSTKHHKASLHGRSKTNASSLHNGTAHLV